MDVDLDDAAVAEEYQRVTVGRQPVGDHLFVEGVQIHFAALEAQGKLEPAVKTVEVSPVNGVRTCVPQVLHLPEGGEPVRLFMRVGAPDRKVTLEVKCGDEVIVKKLLPVVKPSEMITLDIPAAKTVLMHDKIEVGLKAK